VKAPEQYSAPALDKGLDILELLCRTETPVSQKEIAQSLGRSVGEIYRMLTCLVRRDYVALFEDTYSITPKLFQLAHSNPPTHRLLVEARPIMNALSRDLDQACHLTVWGDGSQVVIAKLDVPSGMGFSVRLGSDLDVIVSASGRVLLAFQDEAIQESRILEALARRPAQKDTGLERKLSQIKERGFESSHSAQVRGLYAVSFPIYDAQGHALAALTVPVAERIDQAGRKSIDEVEVALAQAASLLSSRMGGRIPQPA
jgi:DNA-binding IclR family transcriptional regulator